MSSCPILLSIFNIFTKKYIQSELWCRPGGQVCCHREIYPALSLPTITWPFFAMKPTFLWIALDVWDGSLLHTIVGLAILLASIIRPLQAHCCKRNLGPNWVIFFLVFHIYDCTIRSGMVSHFQKCITLGVYHW